MAHFFRILAVFTIIIVFIVTASAQDKTKDYMQYYNKGEYEKSYEILKERILEIYDLKNNERRIPIEAVSVQKLAEKVDLNKLFKERKAAGFFIEDDPDLHKLHVLAGKCLYNLEKYDQSLSHFYQSLRYTEIKFNVHDAIFYDMALVFKKSGRMNAYRNALEAAYTLNPSEKKYSLDLGMELYSTREKKKAIYHLERYVSSTDENSLDPKIYLMLSNLYESTGKFLNTSKNYIKYLERKPDDGYIQFALGYLSYKRTGNYGLARSGFSKALELLPQDKIFRRSKAGEYLGDIERKEMNYREAIKFYLETIKYQDMVKNRIEKDRLKIEETQKNIREIKKKIITNREYEKYSEYEMYLEEKDNLILGKRENIYAYNKLNAGKVRWNIAESYEKLEKLNKSVEYYRQSIRYNYNTDEARIRIIKLQLKIKRGY